MSQKTSIQSGSRSLAADGTSVQINCTGTFFLCTKADADFLLSFDGSRFIPWTAGRLVRFVEGEAITKLWVGLNKKNGIANAIEFIYGNADISDFGDRAYPTPTNLIGIKHAIPTGGQIILQGIAKDSTDTTSGGPDNYYQRIKIKLTNSDAAAHDVNLVGSNGGILQILKAGTTSDWFETTDDITVTNASGATVTVYAAQVVMSPRIKRI